MTCAIFADVLVDLAREIPMERAMRASALAHAATCRECGDRLAEQRMLSADLVALAAADEGQHVPDWIEASLRARLRAESRLGVTQRFSGPRRWIWTSVTAAAALLAVVSLLTAQKGPATPPRMAAETASVSPASSDGSFLTLSYGDSLADLDALQVVRVEVQPTALASLGWTLGAESDGPVEAELLVGQDGVARGIRFVD